MQWGLSLCSLPLGIAQGIYDCGCELQEARQQLLVMVGVLRELDVERGGGHTAAADMAYLYAMTQVWFTVERNYKVPHLTGLDLLTCMLSCSVVVPV